MSDVMPAAATESAKRKWAAPHVIQTEVARGSEHGFAAPGTDFYGATLGPTMEALS